MTSDHVGDLREDQEEIIARRCWQEDGGQEEIMSRIADER